VRPLRARPSDAMQKHILIVEDEAAIRDMLAYALR
jgi:DNA-binding NtrC family response regulator